MLCFSSQGATNKQGYSFIARTRPQSIFNMSFYGKPTRANQALYDITKDLCSGGVLVNRGTPYPCTQEDLDSYRHFPRGLYSFDPIGADEAVWRLLDSLDPFREPSRTVQSALRRLYAGINMRHKAPDIVIKAFRDLDIVFFGGNLSGSCRVFVSITPTRKS